MSRSPVEFLDALLTGTISYNKLPVEFAAPDFDRLYVARELWRLKKNDLFFSLVRLMPQDEVFQVLPELVSFAAKSDIYLWGVKEIIKQLPREQVVGVIEKIADEVVNIHDSSEYINLLSVYIALDKDLAKCLAQRAATEADPDIQELGARYLEKNP